MPIKLVPKQFDGLVEHVRGALDRLRQQERAIMQLCVRDARMPRADFLRQFPEQRSRSKAGARAWPKARPSTPKPSAVFSRTSCVASRN